MFITFVICCQAGFKNRGNVGFIEIEFKEEGRSLYFEVLQPTENG